MTNLLKLKEKSYLEYLHYKLNDNDIEELRELCYSSSLELSRFFNDIERIRDKDYNKQLAYKDLACLVLYIQKLENEVLNSSYRKLAGKVAESICLKCQKAKGKIQVACPFRSISNDYCEEYEQIEEDLEMLNLFKELFDGEELDGWVEINFGLTNEDEDSIDNYNGRVTKLKKIRSWLEKQRKEGEISDNQRYS